MYYLIIAVYLAAICTCSQAVVDAIAVAGEDHAVHIPTPTPVVILSTETQGPIQHVEVKAIPEKSKPDQLRLMLKRIDIAKSLWRDEKGDLFQVFRVPEESAGESTIRQEISDSHTPHHVQDILFPKGLVNSGPEHETLVQQEHGECPHHNLGGLKIRKYIKGRTARTFWPFTPWYDDCSYGGCYPPYPYPPPPPPPYYPPPPPYWR